MKEGEPILGGPQANPGVTNVPNGATSAPTFGPQPIASNTTQEPVSPNPASRAIFSQTPPPSSFTQSSTNPLPPQHYTPQQQIVQQPQPISSGTGDIIISTATQKSNKKKKIATVSAVITILVILITVVSVFLINYNSNSVSKSEVYSAVADFYYGYYNEPIDWSNGVVDFTSISDNSYKNLLDKYNTMIGFIPDLRQTTGLILFPFTDGWITDFNKDYEAVQVLYQKIQNLYSNELTKDQEQILEDIKTSSRKNLDIMHSNVSMLSDFYDAFAKPIYQLYSGKNIITCAPTEEISTLLQSPETSSVAEKYYLAYCEAIELHDTTEDSYMMVSTMTTSLEASEAMDEVLITIDPDSTIQIESFLEELEDAKE